VNADTQKAVLRRPRALKIPARRPPFTKDLAAEFKNFIDVAQDRFVILNRLLSKLDFHYSVVKFGESRHFFISSVTKECPPVVLIAHYDSVPGSPGANDNAAAVFMLIEAGLELKKRNTPWMFILTDKEEICAGGGIRSQGSYLLAKGLKNTALAASEFYILDSCGRGNTLVISTTADYLIKNETGTGIAAWKKNLKTLRNNAMAAAERSAKQSVILLPAPFSDDAGFLHAGLAAQMITALPQREAAAFASLSRTNPDYIHALVKNEPRGGLDMSLIPKTWTLINTPNDTEGELTPEYFAGIIKFAFTLALNLKN
jgi:hypothetical protein